jgi:hypothetical protein
MTSVRSVYRFLTGRLGDVDGFSGESSRSKEWRSRQESASMSTLWQCWLKRSTRATTQAAPGKTVPHCLKARLVEITVERCSWRRLMML